MTDFTKQQREAEAIRADMQKAYAIIADAKNRYIKSKLRLKSKKQAADAELLFADLANYGSKDEIHNSYGYAEISDSERERLMNLWDEREQHTKDGKKYSDRVIEMLDKASSHIGDKYQDFLHDADMIALENERNQKGRFPKST
jgi:hypothetical protein